MSETYDGAACGARAAVPEVPKEFDLPFLLRGPHQPWRRLPGRAGRGTGATQGWASGGLPSFDGKA
jgi:hypothetical protein